MKHNTKYSLDELKDSKGVRLYDLAKSLIPGGTQLLSKRPEMFAPDIWPAYYSKAKGCQVWDLENRPFIDMSIMSVGACILGYADDDVDEAVIECIKKGVNSSLNAPEEFELAEALISLHPWFDMIRYARSGGEAMGIAVRIARASTKRDIVMFSGYHGWNDWYLAANLSNSSALDGQLMPGLEPNGVPRALLGTAFPFDANSINSLKDKTVGKESKIAAIVIEPARGELAEAGYLKDLRSYADEIGAVLIFDEITSGFRMCPGGIHRKYKVHPDIAVFAKSMANGYAMSAILGVEKVMQAAQNTFISSTNWTDRVGPVAALATLNKYQATKADAHIINIGNKVKAIWKKYAHIHKLDINITGLPSLAAFDFAGENKQVFNTLFTIMMLEDGFLGFRQFKPSLAHRDEHLAEYEKAIDRIFQVLSLDKTGAALNTPVHHARFEYLTKE
jgi:glutamate-1-semialdehyde 2,1-aminomutase